MNEKDKPDDPNPDRGKGPPDEVPADDKGRKARKHRSSAAPA